MEVKFNKKPLKFLRPFFSQVHTQEQTQEIRLPDAYPDIGKILGCWGRVLVRGKEWRSGSIGANGGVLTWVLYAPEDGTQPRVVDAWIPIQCRWDFPENADDGIITLRPVLTSLDSRGISARKMMIRAGVDTFAQAMKKEILDISEPTQLPEDIQILKRTYPMDLPMEAGEKQVQIEENLSLPSNLPPIHKIVHYDIALEIQEQKVLGNRLVFRGQAEVHLMYMTDDGELHHFNTEIPFSQYTELDGDYGSDATAWIVPVLTAMELELTEPGQLLLRAGIAAQYTIFDKNVVELVEDAFSPYREVVPKVEQIPFSDLLDSTKIEISAMGKLDTDIERILCTCIYGEYPELHLSHEGTEIGMDGQFQILGENPEGQLADEKVSFTASVPFQSAPVNHTDVWLGDPAPADIMPNTEGYTLRTTYPVMVHTYSGGTLPMVTELEIGQQRQADPDRPSIVIRRAADEGLWAIAKVYGSTVDAIMQANQLAGEPENGQMLLIPVS